jgi:hypothetical protein
MNGGQGSRRAMPTLGCSAIDDDENLSTSYYVKQFDMLVTLVSINLSVIGDMFDAFYIKVRSFIHLTLINASCGKK